MEGRMTVCNMSIEAGARAGLVAPDDTTFAYLEGRAHAPKGAAWDAAVDDWRTLRSDDDAAWDREVRIDAATLRPQVTWGTNPGQVTSIDGAGAVAGRLRRRDDPRDRRPGARVHGPRRRARRSATSPSTPCSSGRARTAASRTCAPPPPCSTGATSRRTRVMVVPGSHAVKAQAEAEGLDRVFRAAGADWREPGCSMCLAMNPDKLAPGERAASTSNRNFEGRQGRGGRTHLVSPAVAAATAVAGHFATPDDLDASSMKARAASISGIAAAAAALRRRHRPDHPGRVAQAGRAHRASRRACSPRGATTATSCSTTSATPAPRSSSPGRRSASARRASTPCGRSSSTASTP